MMRDITIIREVKGNNLKSISIKIPKNKVISKK